MLLAACLVGCSQSTAPQVAPRAELQVAHERHAPCDGLRFSQVIGRPPSYAAKKLRRFPARRAACRGLWLPHMSSGFVPQSMALQGRTIWIAGYRWNNDVSLRPCRLMHIGLAHNRLIADQARLVGAPGTRKPTFCRHGGGLAIDRHGLWLAEKARLWLVDPAKVGRGHAVIRVWRLRTPVFGSTAVLHGNRIGLGLYRRAKDAGITWFRIKDLLTGGVLDLVGKAHDSTELAPISRGRIAGHAQGLTYRPGDKGLWVSATGSRCGVLVRPGGAAVDVVPRIEDFEFTGHNRVWVLSEASARVFQHPGGPTLPMLTEYDAAKVLAGPNGARCSRS